MKKIQKIYLFIIVQLVVCFPILAQQTPWEDPAATTKGEIKDANFTVVIDRVNTLPPAFRVFSKVDVVEDKEHFEVQNYEFNDYKLNVPDIESKVKIVGIKPDEPKPVLANYVKAGFGNYVTPYLDVFLGSKEKENYVYGLRLKHLSSSNGPVSNSGNSNNEIGFWGKYFMSNYTLSGGVDYLRKRVNFYGYDRIEGIPEPSSTSVKQVVNNVVTNVLFETSAKNNSALTFKSGLQYSYLSDFYKASENEIVLNAAPKYEIDKDRAIIGNINFSYSNRSDSGSLNRFMFVMRPQYSFNISKFKIKAGFDFTYENDSTKSTSNGHFYPLISAEREIMENKLIAEAGFDGGMEKNTLRSVLGDNMFINSQVNVSNTNKKMDFYVGLKGSLLKNLTFATKLSYRNYKNMYFFMNDSLDQSKFNIVYDNGTTSLIKYNGELTYNQSDKFRIGVKGEYNHYETSKIEKAWHKPVFLSNIFATYNLSNKLLFYLDVYNLTGLVAYDFKTKKEKDLNAIFDVNLRTDYRYSEKFSAFLELNNLFAQKYERYLNCQNKGLNLILGITYRF